MIINDGRCTKQIKAWTAIAKIALYKTINWILADWIFHYKNIEQPCLEHGSKEQILEPVDVGRPIVWNAFKRGPRSEYGT